MHERQGVSLSSLTTLRVGGVANRVIELTTADELVDHVRRFGRGSYLLVGGGSNLVVSDDGVRDPVLAVQTRGVTVNHSGDEVLLDVAAGEPWDALVDRCVAEGWQGVEALAGIPGSVGATPIQNVGAYGQDVSDVISHVEVFDNATDCIDVLAADACAFGYRTSRFKSDPGRFVVLSVQLRVREASAGRPVRYAELAQLLGIELGDVAPIAAVREAVLELRRAKGMVLDDDDHDTWSAGSFFLNPLLGSSEVPLGAPQWPYDGRSVKTSAAWLIEQAGFAKGFGAELGSGAATLSTKHTLAVTNRGAATTEDVLRLARTVRDGVLRRFGITLHPEPTLVGVAL